MEGEYVLMEDVEGIVPRCGLCWNIVVAIAVSLVATPEAPDAISHVPA